MLPFLLCSLKVEAQKIIPVDSSKAMTLRVDPSNAMGGVVSDFFTEVNYVPLETTDESLFGSIAQLEVVDDYYIILDHNTHSILIFTKTGKFHAKIKSVQGSGSNYIWDFCVNKWTKHIIFTKDGYKTLSYADYDGKVVKSVKLQREDQAKDEISTSHYYFISPDKAISTGWYNKMDSTDKYWKTYSKSLIHYSNDDHKVYAQGLGFKDEEANIADEIISSGLGPLTASGTDSVYFYSKPYTNTIYSVTPNTIKLSYKFIFPYFSSLPMDFITNKEYDKKRYEYFQKHNDAIFCVSNTFASGDNLIFRTATWGSGNKEDNLIYNLKTGTLIAYKHIAQDEKSYHLAIYDQATYNSFEGLLASTNGKLYSSISSLGMFKAHEAAAEQKAQYPRYLQTTLKKAAVKTTRLYWSLS
ncbi:6-bladed beta-propeller [Mucilaginibacter antarcticus]|uniref:6-bladed beta-propeller n=1 Tax=Mucilaginibacter antarcticus TaxID=1855725 RepID=UPI0036313F94